MSPPLALVLATVTVIGVAILTTLFLERLETRDIERAVEERRRAGLHMAYRGRYLCGVRGHKYRLRVGGWHCPVCGDTVLTDDEGGVA